MTTMVGNVIIPGRFNNYLIAGNVCNAFALGELGSSDDFFLVGAEPPDESPYPLLSGNILDTEGHLLFRLVRNLLVLNPGHCSKTIGDLLGYEIHDSAGKMIFKVRTVFDKLPGHPEGEFITTISANFCDKKGRVVFTANSGEAGERIEASLKAAFGFSGGSFGIVQGLTNEELDFTRIVLATRGVVHQRLSGEIEGQEIVLDGKALHNAHIKHCKITIRTGEFAAYGPDNRLENNQIVFEGPASNVFDLIKRAS